MQNLEFLNCCIAELSGNFPDVEIIEGDRYFPVHGVRVKNYAPTRNAGDDTLAQSAIHAGACDLVIPVPRCSGYFSDAVISGVHLSKPVHVEFGGEVSMIPFCVKATEEQLGSLRGYYPLYEDTSRLREQYFICLLNEQSPPVTLSDTMRDFDFYVQNYLHHCETIAKTQLAKLASQEAASAARWLDHLTSGISPTLRAHLVGDTCWKV